MAKARKFRNFSNLETLSHDVLVAIAKALAMRLARVMVTKFPVYAGEIQTAAIAQVREIVEILEWSEERSR